ncbi:hypothetical protein EDD15DRAFT_2436455 [Pisolithus albus]|nr:hypothetical protein EDD15DRAFT_2436455 [Pisolithus albus]
MSKQLHRLLGSIRGCKPFSTRLTKDYPNAYSDFYPSKAGCVYKSGPPWEVRTGFEAQGIPREPRTVCRPEIAAVWPATLKRIINCLDDLGVQLTCINPFAWANEGDDKPFCELLISVGVTPRSLKYTLAVSAAVAVKEILASINLPTVEVAFVEMVVMHQGGAPPLLPLDPVIGGVPEYRKHFTYRLGMPIAPLSTPYLEGTGGLFLKIGNDPVLLTCAHVARPPPVFDNTGMQRVNIGQPKEYIVALGAGAYNRVVRDMMGEIAKIARDIETFNIQLQRPNLPQKRREEKEAEVVRLTKRCRRIDALHTEVTKFRSTPELRSVGWVLYSSVIKADASVGNEELGYTQDWALVQLDPRMLNMETFDGNKLFFGDKFMPGRLARLMWPNPEDQADYKLYTDGQIQVWDVVPPEDITHPPHLDANGMPTLFVIMNGSTSGTRVGRANGLFSAKRTSPEYGIDKVDSLEIAVIAYGGGRPKFSEKGDSGAGVFDRKGRVLGHVNGGAGTTDETDVTFITPFWWINQRILEVYPNAKVYPVTGRK